MPHRFHNKFLSNHSKSRSRLLRLRLLEIYGVCLLTGMSKIDKKNTKELSLTYLNELQSSWRSLINRDGLSWTNSGSKRTNISIQGTENLNGQWLLDTKDQFSKIHKCHNSSSSSCHNICLLKASTHRLLLINDLLCMMKHRCSSWWEINRWTCRF